MDNTEFRNIVNKEIEKVPGRLGLFYKNLHNGEILMLGGRDEYEAASVIKLIVMAEAFRQFESGSIDLEESYILKESDKVPSGDTINYAKLYEEKILSDDMFPESGILNFFHEGIKLTLRDLIKAMIIISDNTAMNILVNILGIDAINGFAESLGMKKTRLNRLLFDESESGKGNENIVSLREIGYFFEKLYCGALVSENASMQMSAILQNQQTTYKIPFYLEHIPVAHKTGEDNGITNDVGIIFGENPFILCFAANETDVSMAAKCCQRIAKVSYEYTNQ